MNKTLWVKLSVDYYDDPKIVAAGCYAELLFVRGLAYAKKNNNPAIPKVMIYRLAIGIDFDAETLAGALVEHGLWTETDTTFRIAAWDTWQANNTTGQSAGGTLAMHNRWHKNNRSSTCQHCQDGATDDKQQAPKKEPKQAMMFLPEVVRACKQLADRMVANGAKEPNISDAWLTEMEKLNRIDGHDWTAISEVIDWCQNDPFWKSNILSPAKLRKQFDQLNMKRLTPVRTTVASSNPDAEAAWLDVQQQVRNVGSHGAASFATARTRNAVRSIGWRNICQTTQPEVMKRQFIAAYIAANNDGD